MQVKFFTIPIIGGEAFAEELNTFLRAKKILKTKSKLVSNDDGTYWCYCINYADELGTGAGKPRVDYKLLLDEATFKRFSHLREIRKSIAEAESIPAFAVFTDEELSEIAKLEQITPSALRGIKGIGEKKVAKYAEKFMEKLSTT